MTAPTLFAGDGEPCGSCGAPLAADQRYCLTCGARRATARLPFLEILRDDASTQLLPLHQPVAPGAVPGAVPPPADGSLAGRARANTGLIASVGVLLLAMLIGVLIGSGFARDNGGVAAANQKPVVVSVGGAAAAPAAAAPTATTPTDAGASSTDGAGSTSTAKGKAAKSPIKTKAASTKKLKDLSKLSGKEYQKQVDKLGKNIAVGGKAPPKDKKPAAGGGSFQEIG
jgi:hypothetical protein